MKKVENNPIKFTDRNKENKILNDSFIDLMNNNQYFKVLSFYGIGGIGKSRLINYALDNTTVLENQNVTILKINLEIVKSDNVLNAIFGLRKQIPTTCPCFDYAIINFWNKYSPNELYTDFSKSILEQCFSFLSNKSDFVYKGVNVFPIVNDIIHEIKNLTLDSIYYSEIESLNYDEFLKKIPEYLGIDIHGKYFDKYLVFFIDAYEEYNTKWLEKLIENIGYGVFIVTSREKLKWNRFPVSECKLSELPDSDTRKLLSSYNINDEQIQNIIDTTDCIPIYVELAIRAIENNSNDFDFLFKDKNDIVNKFFNHLKKEQQELLIVLSLIQIFNEEIFEKIVKSLNLQISLLEFFDLKELSIIQNVEDFDDFYKIHDVVSNNIMKIHNYDYRKKVFDNYLNSIRLCKLTDLQKTLLYKHILNLFIQNGFSLDKNTCEIILDLFFYAKGTLLPIQYNSVVGYETNTQLKPIYYFTKAIYNEREASYTRLFWLETIKNNTDLFGKHKKSFDIIYGYLNGLIKNQSLLFSTLTSIDETLTPSDSQEWFYGQTKVFLGDYNVTQGNFETAKASLNKYKLQLKYQPEIINNFAFQVNRHLGHLYRFNMFCSEAMEQYNEALHSNEIPTELQKVYIFTNFCETACLYDYSFVQDKYCEYLELCKKYNDLKSMAKIYCSIALVHIKNKKYKLARKCIRKSLYLNTIDGYKSGIMFSYLHMLYLEKKLVKKFTKNTMICFNNQLELINRYGYIKLPISILNNDLDSIDYIKENYEWLDFDKTINEYNRMFSDLGLKE